MTVEEMRALMRRRVVPENLVVQNIVEYLMDDSAQLPKLNAFSFLNRLQQLGMASADFVVLLEGCSAPQPLVDKIKANPAMNLNSLVLAFESSGLTSEDYSQMLYTARLVWEQTQTSGGTVVPDFSENSSYEKTEAELFDDLPETADNNLHDNYEDEELEDTDEPNFEEIMKHIRENAASDNISDNTEKQTGKSDTDSAVEKNETEAAESAVSEETEEAQKETEAEKTAEKVENSLPEAEETPSIEPVRSDTIGERFEEATKEIPKKEILDAYASSKNTNETEEKAKHTDEDLIPKALRSEADNSDEDKPSDNETEKGEAVSNEKTSGQLPNLTKDNKSVIEDAPLIVTQKDKFNDTSTLIVKFDPEQLKKDIADEAEQEDEADVQEETENTFGSDESFYGSLDEDDGDNENEDSDDEEETDEEDSDDGFSDDDEEEEYESYGNSRRLRASGYNKPALVVSALGAVILLVMCAYFTFVLKLDSSVKNLVYAKNNGEIFSEVYNSYNEENKRIIGGENARYYFKSETLFGNMLVSQEDFGIFSDGRRVYTAYSDRIISHDDFDVNAGTQSDILPPDDTRFVDVWEGEGCVIAVFTGIECGFMRIENGNILFTVKQDGGLCDFAVFEDKGEISFGSVYVPHYTQNFTVTDVNEYLPRLGKNEKSVISAENIVLGFSSGCSYAVWGKYSLLDGSITVSRAAIGDPVYSGANGVCVMNYEDKNKDTVSRIIRFSEETDTNSGDNAENAESKIRSVNFIRTERITAAADSSNLFAVITGNDIKLFDKALGNGFEEKGKIAELPKLPKEMKFEGEMLILNGDEGIFAVYDCSDITAPKAVEIQRASGVVSRTGESAVIFDTDLTNNTLKAALLKLENGTVTQTSAYSKSFSAAEAETLELGGANTAAVLGDNCAFSYKYFDGVSVVSVCALFGEETDEKSLFDDKTGFNAVFAHSNRLIAVSSKGAEIVFE